MGTKGRGPGSQHNPRGVNQGVTLTDPQSGNPIDTVVDTNGIKRLAVDGNFTAQNVQATVELDFNEDSVQIGDPATGATLKINPDGSIDTNIESDAADGDNIGLKVQERNSSPSDSQYNKRVTAVTGSDNTDTTSMDVSLHDHQGNEVTDRNPFQVSTNYEKIIQAILASNWMTLANYDGISTSVSSDRQTIQIDFKEDTFVIGTAFVNYISDLDWNFTLERYINDDDGSQLDDDDDTPLFLE